MRGIFARRRARQGFRRLSDAKGANLVEAAVITPLLLLLTFSIVDFASAFYAYLALEHGVSQATRYAVTGREMSDPSGTSIGREASIKQAMRSATPTLTIPDGAFAFTFMAPNTSSWASGLGGPGDVGRVQVTYEWNFMTPLIRPFFTNGKMSLVVQSTMRNESVFEATP
jgi:Flp pilus assembly protein TadG